ncbi:MAG TPA: hypothetical protein VG498_23065 [Terriglobales bacterium]|nr:hypothetical protein [Terriglobales bacterium]
MDQALDHYRRRIGHWLSRWPHCCDSDIPFLGMVRKRNWHRVARHSGPADWVFELLIGTAALVVFLVLEWKFRREAVET